MEETGIDRFTVAALAEYATDGLLFGTTVQ